MKTSLFLLLGLTAIFVSACSSENNKSSKPSAPTTLPGEKNNDPSDTSSPAQVAGQGLIGSRWTGEGSSSDGNKMTYFFHFTKDSIQVKSTCYSDGISGDLKSTVGARYSNDGKIVEFLSGIESDIPIPNGSCSIYFPQGLKFELENDRIILDYQGNRRTTDMKREK